MTIFSKFSIVILILALSGPSMGQITLLDQGRSDYQITIASGAAPDELRAASEFQNYFHQITGVIIPIFSEETAPVSYEIIIGTTKRLDQYHVKTAFKPDEKDGFIILTKQNNLFIVGGSPKGTLNGVYTFFENYLGCRLYSPEVAVIPAQSKIVLPEIHDRQIPFFTYRELLFPGRYDTNYLAWHKLHSHHDGSWGMWVHTFDDLIPPEKYFSEHPEYFSEINGKRADKSQLCLSNPDVFSILAGNLRKKMDARPEAYYWSVSQNDNFLSCQCDECKKIAEQYGGESGLMIWFVNQVAALFPEKTISTLAYQYTRSAPKHIKPLPNVNIMLCTIECNRSKPIAEDPSSASFVKDIKAWTKLTDNILIWDYVVQFRNYISPFPNLDVLQPNLKFFADKGCRLMFQQGSSRSLSEFVDLRSYIIAKLLWNPELDPKEIQSDFIYGYYGDAAPYISEYIGMIHDELESTGGDLWIYGYPYTGIASFLRPSLIPVYTELLDKAQEAVKDQPVFNDRVIFARLPLDYAILDISLHNVDEDLSWFSNKEGQFEIKEDMVNLLDTFVSRCNRLNVNTLNEQNFSPEDYRTTVKRYLMKSSERHLALDKPVELLTTFSPKYDAGGAAALTDGLRGINDYHYSWLGFEGEDLEAVIDLGKEILISEISVDFLQDIQAWVFLPKSMTVYSSIDGEELFKIGTVENITPDDKSGAFIQTFTIRGPEVRARYLRVRAESLKTCPTWHIGAGKSCWIFTDEIVVK